MYFYLPIPTIGYNFLSTKYFFQKLKKCKKSEINLVDGSRHEVFNEINKEESFNDLIKFIDSNIE